MRAVLCLAFSYLYQESHLMSIFCALWIDRHCDPDVKLFSTQEAAIGWASKTVREYDRFGQLDETITGPMSQAGTLYYGRYSSEGCHIEVFAREIDAEIIS